MTFCLIHDKAFERGFIYLDDEFQARVSSRGEDELTLPLLDFIRVTINKPIRSPHADPPRIEYVRQHRGQFGL